MVRKTIMKYSRQITNLANEYDANKIKGWQFNPLWYN
jgi:hypothetical protein